jgi:hypothetical protein
MTERLAAFYEYNPPVETYARPSGATIEKYRPRLPDYFIEAWERDGLFTLSDGFFWLVNPDEYVDLLSWFFPENENLIVIMRTAFGGLIFYDQSVKADDGSGKEAYSYLCPIYLTVTPFTSALDAVLNGWLTSPEIYDPLMFHTIYTVARERLPAPQPDECYGFVPAIALGGDLYPDQIAIFKMKEHLAFLSQLR